MGQIFGSKSLQSAIKLISGETINDIRFDIDNEGDSTVIFTFSNDVVLALFDGGNYWYHGRKYFHTDDDMKYFIGSQFLTAEVRLGPEKELDNILSRELGSLDGDESYWQESEFLVFSTDKGQFTIVSYNEHNGYYGGFDLFVRVSKRVN